MVIRFRDDMFTNPFTLFDIITGLETCLIVANVRGKVVYATAAVERLLGWSPEVLQGEDLSILIPDRLLDRHASGFARAMDRGHLSQPNRTLRLWALHKDGHEVPIELTLYLYEDREGDQRVIGIMRNIREYVEIEQDLRSEVAFLKAATDNLAVGMLVCNAQGEVMLINKRAAALYGSKRTGLPIRDYVDELHMFTLDGRRMNPEDLPILQALQGHEATARAVVRHDDGMEVVIDIDAHPVRDDGGLILGAVLAITEVVTHRELP